MLKVFSTRNVTAFVDDDDYIVKTGIPLMQSVPNKMGQRFGPSFMSLQLSGGEVSNTYR